MIVLSYIISDCYHIYYELTIFSDDKGEQTLMVTLLDTAIVTDPLINEMVEEGVQCIGPIMVHNIVQTKLVELKDSECITIVPEYTVC